MAKRPVKKHRSWGFYLFGDAPDEGDTNGRDSHPFYGPLDQSHGLITYASTGCQKDYVHTLRLQSTGHFRGTLFEECLYVLLNSVTHESEMGSR